MTRRAVAPDFNAMVVGDDGKISNVGTVLTGKIF
jgi:hypothetical protein